jgi:hypothetical protein
VRFENYLSFYESFFTGFCLQVSTLFWFAATFGYIFTICRLGSELKNVKDLIVSQVAHLTAKKRKPQSEVLQLKFHDIDLKIIAMEMVEIDMELFVEVCGLIEDCSGYQRMQTLRVISI